MEEYFANLVKDKRIVLVGPAVTIQGQAGGPQIESYDLVVRMNWGWPVAPDLHQDYGERMNILYHCSCWWDDEGRNAFNRIFTANRTEEINIVCYTVDNERHARNALHLVQSCLDYNKPCLKVDKLVIGKLLGTLPTTGLVAIHHLLSHPIKELYVTGMTFHQTGYRNDYPALTPCSKSSLPVWARGVKPTFIGPHHLPTHLNYFANMVKNDPRLKPDKALQDLLPSA